MVKKFICIKHAEDCHTLQEGTRFVVHCRYIRTVYRVTVLTQLEVTVYVYFSLRL